MATLELSDEQLSVISKACELLSRIYMGQLEEVAWLFSSLPEARYQELTETLKALNSVTATSNKTTVPYIDARKFSSYGKSGSTWVCTFSFYQNTAPK